MGIYQRGQTVKLTVAFEDASGTPANPTTVVCKVERPDGTESTYTSASTPAVSNPTTGSFQVTIAADQTGTWRYRWEGAIGTTTPVDEQQFHVLGSAF